MTDIEFRFNELMKNSNFYFNSVDNYSFIQYNGPTINDSPNQGLKLHLSANNTEDYLNLLESVVPDLINYGATFKIVKLERVDDFLAREDSQQGKMITIYDSPWDAEAFFEKHQELLYCEEPSIRPRGDQCLGGRVFGRYGCNKGQYVVDPETNEMYMDNREIPYPPFIKGISMSDYIDECNSGLDQIERDKYFKALKNFKYIQFNTKNSEYEFEFKSIENGHIFGTLKNLTDDNILKNNSEDLWELNQLRERRKASFVNVYTKQELSSSTVQSIEFSNNSKDKSKQDIINIHTVNTNYEFQILKVEDGVLYGNMTDDNNRLKGYNFDRNDLWIIENLSEGKKARIKNLNKNLDIDTSTVKSFTKEIEVKTDNSSFVFNIDKIENKDIFGSLDDSNGDVRKYNLDKDTWQLTSLEKGEKLKVEDISVSKTLISSSNIKEFTAEKGNSIVAEKTEHLEFD